METSVTEELKVCREERDILEQKLHIHLDRWTLDKIMYEEMTAKAEREHCLKEAEQSYELARQDMSIGSQQQQLIVLKLKLDSATEDLEFREVQFSALTSQLQEQRKWQDSVTEKVQEMKASFKKKGASERSQLVMETERKVHHLQKLLDDRVQSHKAEVGKIKGKHALVVTQLKEEVKQLSSRGDDMRAQKKQRTVEREQLQAVARERDDLRAEQEQWRKDRKELHAGFQERESLRRELEKRISKQTELQAVVDERDRLITEKARFNSREKEMVELLKERDGLNVQLEHLISQREEIQMLVKKRDKLKHELDLTNAQRQEEVRALVRERDFVWSQMKKLEEDYGKRIKKMAEQNLQDRQEIERLNNKLKAAHVGNNDMMVEMTILKLEVKRVEDTAIGKLRAFEAELQELQSTLVKVRDEKETLIADAEKRESRLLELVSRKETLGRPDCSLQDQGAVADCVKEGPEVLNAGDGLVQDHEILESQIEQAAQAHRNDEKEPAKAVEDLRRENENLRILYAELEDALREKNQNPTKVARKGNHRDPTSRNLKSELEAAAASSPSDGSPITAGNVRKERPKRDRGKRKLALGTNSTQKNVKGASSKSARAESHSLEHVEVSKGTASISKIPRGEYVPPRQLFYLIVFVPSPKTLRQRTRAHYSDSKIPELNVEVDENDHTLVKKRRKRVDKDSEFTQDRRPPLHTLPNNQKSSTKSSASGTAPLPESQKKAFTESPNKTSKMMANLFSTAFSVPKLKTPSHLMT